MKLYGLILTAAIAMPAMHVHAQPAQAGPAAASSMTRGEVRKIDKEAGKLTLRHERIEHLEMSGMTMVFRVADTALLDGLMPGDKVRFAADRVNGAITVTAIERQQ